MDLLLKNGHVIDPGRVDGHVDVLIRQGRIDKLIPNPQKDTDRSSGSLPSDIQTIDLTDKIVTPGLIDMHVHLREPGQSHKETIETGGRAAAHGGFVAVCSMPNTDPVTDTADITAWIQTKARNHGCISVYPCAAISHGLRGKALTDFNALKKAGAVALSDDGMPVMSKRLMQAALEKAKSLDLPIVSHAEDLELAAGGAMNAGRIADELGIPGIPNTAESVMVTRDIALSEMTGARLHIAHVSTAESVSAIRRAKNRGIRVTAETAPHYFMLTHQAVKFSGTHAKMNPPLRSERDRQAIIQGLADGTLDAIATDHAPHHVDEKQLPFEKAPNGIIGLETSLPLGLKLVDKGHLSLMDLIKCMSTNPAQILGIPKGLIPGTVANITVIDLNKPILVRAQTFQSKSRNTPFEGWELRGGPILTIAGGQIAYQSSDHQQK